MTGRARGRGLFIALLACTLATAGFNLEVASVAAQYSGCPDSDHIDSFPDGWTAIDVPFAGLSTAVETYAIDPLDHRRIWASNGRVVMYSEDGGCTWSEVFRTPSLPSQDLPFSHPSARIVAIEIASALGQGSVYLGIADTGGGGDRPHIVRGDDGDEWKKSDVGVLPYGVPRQLLVSTSEPRTAYAWIRGGDGVSLLYRTTDHGSVWELRTRIDPDNRLGRLLDNLDVGSLTETIDFGDIVLDPSDDERLWGTTGTNVYETLDGGHTWRHIIPARPWLWDLGVLAVSRPHPTESARILAFESITSGMNRVQVSEDDGESWIGYQAPGRVASAAAAPEGDIAVIADTGEGAANTFLTYAGGSWWIEGRRFSPRARDVTGHVNPDARFSLAAGSRIWRYRPPESGGGDDEDDGGSGGNPGGGHGFSPPPIPGFETGGGGRPDPAKCQLEVPPPAPWNPGWDPAPEETTPVYVGNFDSGRLVAFDEIGTGFVVGQVPQYAEGMAIDPVGRVVVATRYSNTLTIHNPWTCQIIHLDDSLPLAEGPEFDAAGNLYVNTTGPGSQRAKVWRYPWPQFPGQPRELIYTFPPQAFVEDVRVAPAGSPFSGDLFVLYGERQGTSAPGPGDGTPTSIARFTRSGGKWVRLKDHVGDVGALLGERRGSIVFLGMAFLPEGSLLLSEYKHIIPIPPGDPIRQTSDARIVEIDRMGTSARVWASLSMIEAAGSGIGKAPAPAKIDIAWDGSVYVAGSYVQMRTNYAGPSHDRTGVLWRFDSTGRRLVPDFALNLSFPVGVAAPHFPPPVPQPPPPPGPPDVPSNPPPPVHVVGGPPPPPPPLAPGLGPGPVLNPLQAVAPAPAALPGVGPAPIPAAQGQASSAVQAAAMPQAGLVSQRQEQAQTALAVAQEKVAQQEGFSMAARSRRSNSGKVPITLGGGLALALGCYMLRRRSRTAEVQTR